MMDFLPNLMDFVLKMMGFLPNVMDFVLKMLNSLPNLMDFVLKMLNFDRNAAMTFINIAKGNEAGDDDGQVLRTLVLAAFSALFLL